MYNTDECQELISEIVPRAERAVEYAKKITRIISLLPPDAYFDVSCDGVLEIQAWTQERVSAIRHATGIRTWKKEFDKHCNWWEYHAETPEGGKIRIYAVSEGPPTCKLVEKTVVRTVQKPIGEVRYESVVEEYIVREWVCGDEVEADKANKHVETVKR